jgi:hypothetical protein
MKYNTSGMQIDHNLDSGSSNRFFTRPQTT